jgi:gluconolactonase
MVTGIDQASTVYDVAHPNGAAFNSAGDRLYHADTDNRRLLVSEVGPDGVPQLIDEFSTAGYPGVPDGVVTDQAGGVWVALYGGGQLVRFSADGQVTDRLSVPSDGVTSMCFGGDDMRTLYLTTADHRAQPDLGGCVFWTKMEVAGLPAAAATIS